MPRRFSLDEFDQSVSAEIRSLLDRCEAEPYVFGEEEYLVREHEVSNHCYLVLKGAWTVEKGNNESLQGPLALAIVNNEGEEPCFVGEMAHFGGGARSASLRCSGPTYVLDVPSGAVDTIMQDYPGLTQILCKQLASRLQEANEALTHGSEQLAMDVKQLDVAAGEVVVRAGEPADVLYQLLVGSLIVEGAERPMKPRELPMKFIDPEPYFADGCHQQTYWRAQMSCSWAFRRAAGWRRFETIQS